MLHNNNLDGEEPEYDPETEFQLDYENDSKNHDELPCCVDEELGLSELDLHALNLLQFAAQNQYDMRPRNPIQLEPEKVYDGYKYNKVVLQFALKNIHLDFINVIQWNAINMLLFIICIMHINTNLNLMQLITLL